MLYGAYPSPVLKNLIHLKPVMTLKTRIHFLKSVPSGSRISYGGTFVTRKESLIATFPLDMRMGTVAPSRIEERCWSGERGHLSWERFAWISSWWM